MAEALCSACGRGELEAVRRLLAEGVSPVSVLYGDPALVWAAGGGRAAVVELLLGAGAGVDARGSDGYTPLCMAAIAGRYDVALFLLSLGADVLAATNNNSTALTLSVASGNPALVKHINAAVAKKVTTTTTTTAHSLTSPPAGDEDAVGLDQVGYGSGGNEGGDRRDVEGAIARVASTAAPRSALP